MNEIVKKIQMFDEDFDELGEWRQKMKKKIEKFEEKLKILGSNLSGKKGQNVIIPKEIEEAIKKLQ